MSLTKLLLERAEQDFDDTDYFAPVKCDTCTRKLVAQASKDCGRCVSCRGGLVNREVLDSRQLGKMDSDMLTRNNPYV